ncbi:MAG: hypothetical protein ACI88H_003987, partial [Cocleimonas sp.]
PTDYVDAHEKYILTVPSNYIHDATKQSKFTSYDHPYYRSL